MSRRRIAQWLRKHADRIDPTSGPRRTAYTFTIEHREGLRIRTDGRGCPLWFMEQDHDRAHTEADTRHVRVDWVNGTVDYPGGQP